MARLPDKGRQRWPTARVATRADSTGMKPVKPTPSPLPNKVTQTPPGLLPAKDDLSLPHERDQSTDMTAEAIDPVIEQAGLDVKRGLQDTSKGPEMDKAYDKLKP